MNKSKFDIAKDCLNEFRATYTELLMSAQRLEHALESLSADVLQLEPQNPEVREIVRCVALDYELPISLLLSPVRTARAAEARHLAMLVCREQTKLSFEELGLEFRRHHSGVMHGVKNAKDFLSIDHAFRERYQRLSNAVRHAA